MVKSHGPIRLTQNTSVATFQVSVSPLVSHGHLRIVPKDWVKDSEDPFSVLAPVRVL